MSYIKSLSSGEIDRHGRQIDPSVLIGNNVRIGNNVVIEDNCYIGDNVMIGHGCVIRPRTWIGDNTKISHMTVIEGDCYILNDVCIHGQCHITRGMIIEDLVFMAPFCIFANDNGMKWKRGDWNMQPPILKRACRLAIGVRVIPGVTIGENAALGVGAVVTKDIPPREFWAGVPARFKYMVKEEDVL